MKKIKNEQKRKTNSEKLKFISILRHDIKTPLLAQIRSLEFFLKHQKTINEIEKEIIEENIKSNYFLLNSIENAIFLLELEKNEIKKEKVDFIKEIENCCEEFKKERNNDYKIELKNLKDACYAIDKRLFQELIKHILAMFELSANEKSKVEITLEEDKNFIKFSAKNNTSFMTKEQMCSFDYQNKVNSTDYNQLGMSLNYNIVKKILQVQNWNLILNSSQDDVYEFGFTIAK